MEWSSELQNLGEECYEFLSTLNWFTMLIYLIALIALYAAIVLEYKDLFCPCEGQKCQLGNGAAYAEGKTGKQDTYTDLLRKIRISARYDEASVYWRRCIIYATLLTFILLILVLQRLPNAYEVITSFLLIYLSLFLFINYYQWAVSQPASKQINEIIKKLNYRTKYK